MAIIHFMGLVGIYFTVLGGLALGLFVSELIAGRRLCKFLSQGYNTTKATTNSTTEVDLLSAGSLTVKG